MTERELQGKIVKLLRQLRIEALWHRLDRRSAATVSWPDITFAYHGSAYAWEIKLPTGRLRPEQTEMLERLSRPPNKWSVHVIRSLDEAIESVERLQRHPARCYNHRGRFASRDTNL